ncbi:S24 family peptidase [Atlantibacter subterranea]|uniref:S24 family peptidase n=1 Tax=Atlantibacter subterraneus TaxID=255519 RepID=UPI0020C1C81E|nr:S24 family peptidase [Atlantibacter subterranea]UTJ46622.1 S24 family peptidase [Atlantibacter subterranea]
MSRMEINEIRRRNLRTLLDAFQARGGKKKEFAEQVGIEAPQLTHITSTPPKRNIGDVIARRIEVALGLQRGWLDVSQPYQASENADENKKKFILSQLSSSLSTGQTNSNKFTLIKLTDDDFIGEGNLDSYSSVINEINVDPEYAKNMFGGRDSADLRIHTVSGDSMLGTISPGEVVVLDITVREMNYDGIYLIDYSGRVHLKRLQRIKNEIVVISDNPTYEKWVVSESEAENLNIIGFLIGKWDMNYTRLG